MNTENKLARFEKCILPHLDAAYNLARWLTRNNHDAQDVVQEACLRAYKFFAGFRGEDGRSWLLRIVRNVFYTWLQKNPRDLAMAGDGLEALNVESDSAGPDVLLLKEAEGAALHRAIEEIPVEFREVLIMRELEGMSYKEIADVAGVPMGTVMSRLARARRLLRLGLQHLMNRKE